MGYMCKIPMWAKWAIAHDVVQLQVRKIELKTKKISPAMLKMCSGPWASPCGSNGQMPMKLHNYMSGQFHRTLNWKKSIQLFQIYSFWFMGQMGKPMWIEWANGHDAARLPVATIPELWAENIRPVVSEICACWPNGQINTLHNYRSKPFHRTLNGENPSSGFRVMGSVKSGTSRARPRARSGKIIPVHPEVLRGNTWQLNQYSKVCIFLSKF